MLPESLLLLALDDEKGSVPLAVQTGLPYGLAGGVLIELALAGCIEVDARKHLRALPGAATGEPLLDDALRLIAAEPERKMRYWVEHLERRLGGLRQRLLDDLVAHGTLEKREERVLFFFRRETWPERRHQPEADVRAALDAVLLRDAPGDARTRMLAQLLEACDLVGVLYRGDERKRAKTRIRDLQHQPDAAATAPANAAARAAAEARDAMVTAVIVASLTATTAATTAACAAASSTSC